MKKLLIACVLLLSAAGFCAYRYYNSEVLPEKRLDEAHDEQAKLFERVKPDIKDNDGKQDEDLLEKAGAVNSSVCAWLIIPGTHIDYPVCQAEDNDFYLHNGFDGQYNYELGCPFLDCRCDGDFSGFNSIVYGHHMTGQRMFADINLFKDESFLNDHSSGSLIFNDEVHTVQFFAYLNVYPTAPAYHVVFVTDSEKRDYLEYIRENSDYCKLPADAPDTDELHLLLLSTCTYEFDDARGILVGVIE